MEVSGKLPAKGEEAPEENELTGSLQCSISVYPFHDGKFEDFEPVFHDLINVRNSPLGQNGLNGHLTQHRGTSMTAPAQLIPKHSSPSELPSQPKVTKLSNQTQN